MDSNSIMVLVIYVGIGLALLLPILYLVYLSVMGFLLGSGEHDPNPLLAIFLSVWLIASSLATLFLLVRFVKWAWDF